MASPRSTTEDARPQPRSLTTRAWFAPVLAGLLALAHHALFGLHARGVAVLGTLGLDARFYHEWACDIVAGRAYEGVYFQGPLYPHFLSFVYRLAGCSPSAAVVAQMLVASAGTGLVFVLARRLAGPRAGWAAAALHALYGYGAVMTRTLVPATLLQTLLLASLTLWMVSGDLGGKRRLAAWLGAGLLLGLAALGRGTALLMPLPLIAVGLARGAWRRREAWLAFGVLAVGVAVAVLPVTVRNWRVGGALVPISANGGYNYHLGNSERATGGFVREDGVEFFQPGMGHDGGTVALAEAKAGPGTVIDGPAAASRWWWDQALAWNKDHPGRTLALWGRKLVLALSDYEVPQIEDFAAMRADSAWLRLDPVRFGVLLGLAAAGAVAGRRASRGTTLTLLLAAAGVVLSVLPFFVVARYRLPLVPVLAVLGGFGLVAVVRAFADRARGRGAALIGVAVVVAGAAFIHVPAGVKAVSEMLQEYNRGLAAAQGGDDAEAIRWFTRSTELHPEHGPSWANLGSLLLKTGNPGEAVEALSRAVLLEPGNRRLVAPLVQSAVQARRGPAVAAVLREVVAQAPDNDLAWLLLGDLSADGGDMAAARAAWTEARQRTTDVRIRDNAAAKLAGAGPGGGQ